MRNSLIFLWTLPLFLSSCSKSSNTMESTALENLKAKAQNVLSDTITYGKIIRNAVITLQVESLHASYQKIDSLYRLTGAFLASETEANYDTKQQNTLIIRVPENRFESLLSGISAISKHIDSRAVNSEDVSTQFIDIQARIHAKKEMELRYLDLLKRTGKLNELMQLEDKLAEVRAEIESMQAKTLQLNDQVRYATLTVTLYELIPADLSNHPSFLFQLGSAYAEGLHNSQSILISVIYIWPFILIGAVIFILFKRKIYLIINSKA